MWNRKDVKAKGKAAFKNNFWKCVVTALVIAIIGGGTANFSSGSGSASGWVSRFTDRDQQNNEIMYYDETDDRFVINITTGEDITSEDITPEETAEEITEAPEEIDEGTGVAIVAFMLIMFAIGVVISVIVIAISVLLFNPIRLGCRRFFRKNLDEPANMSNILFAFDNGYKNVVKTMFMRDLFVFLWSLLFVIPGIIKEYEYRLVDYIISEDPTKNYKEALEESRKLMKGNKWKAFVLDLSFIGWKILSLFTCGILSIFYVNPYKLSTDAALYEAIKYGTSDIAK